MCVVPGAEFVNVFSGSKRRAGGDAQRRRGVRSRKASALRAEEVQVGRARSFVARKTGHTRSMLVGHQDEDIHIEATSGDAAAKT